MRTIVDPAGMRLERRAAWKAGRRVGLVPTMGALHEGHLSLVRRCRAECEIVVASIFVNPAQFSPGEDLDRYPRDLEGDSRLLSGAGADILFAPDAPGIYRTRHSTWITVDGLGDRLCGPFRPGHFRGVATVVAKLFNIVRPEAAYFGQKDAQQAAILRRMTADLDFDIEIIVCPTVREPDGLALSSRNVFLTADERREAPGLYAALREGKDTVEGGERSSQRVAGLIRTRLRGTSLRLQYVEVVRASDLNPVDPLEGELLLAAAAYLGDTRLIDNVIATAPRRAPSPRRPAGAMKSLME